MKMRTLAAVLAALTISAGAASAQDMTSEKGKLSYIFGYQLGGQLEQVQETGEQIDINSAIKGIQDAYAKKDPALAEAQAKPVMEAFQKRQQAKAQAAQAEYNKIAGENRTKSTQYMNQYKTQAGVKTLPGGVMYRVLENGTGRKPALTNTVSLQVLGPLPYGTRPQQAVQPQTPNVKVSEIEMQAMRDVITQMPMGSKWEVVLPPEKAFGADPRSGFPPNVAVAFEIKLVNVQ